MTIALLWPRSTFLVDPMVYPPLGLWHIWGALRELHVDAEFFDLSVDDVPFGPEVSQYWVSGTTPQAAAIRSLLIELRRTGKPVVFGGPHAHFHGDDLRLLTDLVVTGPITSSQDAALVLTRVDLGEKSTHLGMGRSLDRLPLPVRDAAHGYRASLGGRPCTTMITSWGCPFRCAFCSSRELWGPAVSYVPLAHVLEDIGVIHSLGFGAVQFYDDILPIRPRRTLAIADELNRYGLIWRCFMRSDLGVRHGLEFLEALRDLGLREVLVGIESASDMIKELIHKGTTTEQDTLLRGWCADLGITYKASIILGLPGETLETMEETRLWLLANRPDKADINVLVPMPGTPLFDEGGYDCRWTRGVTDEYFFKGRPGELECLVETQGLTSDQILSFRNALVTELDVPY